MKVVITARGETLSAPVDPRFGRAEKFIVYDTETKDFSVLDNAQNLNAAQGAGIQAARQLIEAGAEAVITGNCGPKAFSVLTTANLPVYINAQGSVAEAIEQLAAGKLTAAETANVTGHWQ